MPPRHEGKPITNKARRKRKEQRFRAKGYETWVPKRARRKERPPQ